MRPRSLLLPLALLTGCPDGGARAPAAPPPATVPLAPEAPDAPRGGAPSTTPVGQIDRSELKVRMMALRQAAEMYRADQGRWPTTAGELVKTGVVEARSVLDPWGRELELHTDGTQLVIVTLGQDGKPGGEGPDADLRSDQLF